MLVELPTNDEIHDNIVAFWNPGEPAAAGTEYDLGYRLSWVQDTPAAVARFIATRIGAGGVPGQPRPANVVKFVCDLDGKGLEGLDRSSGVEAVVEASRGTLDLVFAFPIATTERWRVTFDLDMGPPDPGDDPDRPAGSTCATTARRCRKPGSTRCSRRSCTRCWRSTPEARSEHQTDDQHRQPERGQRHRPEVDRQQPVQPRVDLRRRQVRAPDP